MELKKSRKAYVERYRLNAFLIGVVVSLSLVYAALEFSYGGSDDTFLSDSDGMLLEELDIMPVAVRQNMIALKEVARKTPSDKVIAVDNAQESVQEVPQEAAVAGNAGEGAGPESEDETAETAISPLGPDAAGNPLDFHVMEDLPQFPGGAVEMMKWLTKNLKYPESAQRRKKQGKVVAQFTIDTDGSVNDIKIIKSVDPQLDKEAMRVLRMMPAWKPGIQNDKPCRTRVVVPIWFRL